MNHPKLTEQERKAAVDEAQAKLRWSQLRPRKRNSYNIGLSVARQIRGLVPAIEQSDRDHLGDLVAILEAKNLEFLYHYDKGIANLHTLENSALPALFKSSVNIQHLLGDIVHRRNNP